MTWRTNKYGAKRAASLDGCRMYHSTLERDRAEELRLMEQAGEITDLQEQPVVHLTPNIRYLPDFSYIERTGERIWEDAKGYETPEFSLKRRLWSLGLGPGPLRIFKRGVEWRVITPGSLQLVDTDVFTVRVKPPMRKGRR